MFWFFFCLKTQLCQKEWDPAIHDSKSRDSQSKIYDPWHDRIAEYRISRSESNDSTPLSALCNKQLSRPSPRPSSRDW